MAFLHVQSNRAAGSAVTSLTNTITATTINNIVVVNLKFNGTTLPTSLSVTDNAATPNTYTATTGSPLANTIFSVYQYYGFQAVGGATQIKVMWTGSLTASSIIDEFSGNVRSQSVVFDKDSSGSGTTTAPSVTSFSPAASGELIVAGAALTSPVGLAAGSNYAFGTNNSNSSTEYRLNGTTTETAPFGVTTIVNWSEIAGAYIPPRVFTSTLTASLTFSGNRNQQTSRTTTGSQSFSGSIPKGLSRGLSASLSTGGSVARLSSALLTASLGFVVASFQRQFSILHAATLNFTGSIQWAISRTLTATLSSTGSLSRSLLLNKSLSASLNFAGVTTKAAARGISATLNFTGSLGRGFFKSLLANLNFNQSASEQSGGFAESGFGDSYFGQGGTETTGGIGSLFVAYIKSKGLYFVGAITHRTILKSLNSNLSFIGFFPLIFPRTLTSTLSFTARFLNPLIFAYNGVLSFFGSLFATRQRYGPSRAIVSVAIVPNPQISVAIIQNPQVNVAIISNPAVSVAIVPNPTITVAVQN